MRVTLSRNFTSDNVTPVCAPIMAALNAANAGLVPSYGADQFTERLKAVAREVFEADVAIFPVATGTAANALALSQIAPAYGAVYCYQDAHIVTDECAAPEFFTGGAKLLELAVGGRQAYPGTAQRGDCACERHGRASRATVGLEPDAGN